MCLFLSCGELYFRTAMLSTKIVTLTCTQAFRSVVAGKAERYGSDRTRDSGSGNDGKTESCLEKPIPRFPGHAPAADCSMSRRPLVQGGSGQRILADGIPHAVFCSCLPSAE